MSVPTEPASDYHGPERRKRARADESLKDTFESIVIAFILAFVFRAYVVEAFVIPTGSMAPTLLGAHLTVTCRQCGHHFAADWPDHSMAQDAAGEEKFPVRLQRTTEAICPMCNYPNAFPRGARPAPGDRILVHKYIYWITEPRRWDVVVFKNPSNPDVNFIKRLVGLPGESIQIVEGNLYVQRGDNPWRIARKTDTDANRQGFKVQQAVWQPIYHNTFVPVDVLTGRNPNRWRVPWVVAAGHEMDWDLAGLGVYRYTGTDSGSIRFDFARLFRHRMDDLYVYNQFKPGAELDPIEDIRLSVTVEPQAPGLVLTLQTTARLDDPDGQIHELLAKLDAKGDAWLVRRDPRTTVEKTLVGPIRVGPLTPGKPRRVELWYVDQEASLWVDSKRKLVMAFDDLAWERIRLRASPPRLPEVRITVSGSPARLSNVELDRDLYYTTVSRGGGAAGLATLNKRRFPPEGQPLHLKADQFFCLGDNSPSSSDGRFWASINPWIEARMLPPDRPNRLDDATEHKQLGIVPRKLIMGRAFFVYWPAPWRLDPQQMGFIPNFGDMRFIH